MRSCWQRSACACRCTARHLQAYVAGGLSMFGAMALTYWSSQFVSSGMIAVLFGLSPLITSLGAMLWLKEEALTTSKLAGMAMGVLGLFLVFRGGLGLGAGSTAGLIALFLAVVSQSLGLVWLKRIDDDSPPLAMTLGILVVALPLFFAAWWMVDGHVPAAIPERAVAATVYLGTFGSVLGFALVLLPDQAHGGWAYRAHHADHTGDGLVAGAWAE